MHYGLKVAQQTCTMNRKWIHNIHLGLLVTLTAGSPLTDDHFLPGDRAAVVATPEAPKGCNLKPIHFILLTTTLITLHEVSKRFKKQAPPMQKSPAAPPNLYHEQSKIM